MHYNPCIRWPYVIITCNLVNINLLNCTLMCRKMSYIMQGNPFIYLQLVSLWCNCNRSQYALGTKASLKWATQLSINHFTTHFSIVTASICNLSANKTFDKIYCKSWKHMAVKSLFSKVEKLFNSLLDDVLTTLKFYHFSQSHSFFELTAFPRPVGCKVCDH